MDFPFSPSASGFAETSRSLSSSSSGGLLTPVWRGSVDAPGREALLQEQMREEDIYRSILLAARQEETPLESLFFPVGTLAFPRADQELVRNAAERDAENVRRGLHGLDEDGNPRWISLHLPDRRDIDKELAPESILPSATESAAPPIDDRKGGMAARKERKGFLSFLLRRFRPMTPEERPLTANPYERLRSARAASAPPPSVHKRFFFRLLRMALFVVILYEVWQILIRWGMSPKFP
jgi:hypothetical protein